VSLHGTIDLNGQRIGAWVVRRLTPLGQPAPDDICVYEWSWADADDPKPRRGELRHRYGNGAASLVSEALRHASRARVTHRTTGDEGDQ
jgi:hypothetical protein